MRKLIFSKKRIITSIILFLMITVAVFLLGKNNNTYNFLILSDIVLFQYIVYLYTSRIVILNRSIKPKYFTFLYILSTLMILMGIYFNTVFFRLSEFNRVFEICWFSTVFLFYITCFTLITKNIKGVNGIPCLKRTCYKKSCINCSRNEDVSITTLIDNELKKHSRYYYKNMPNTFTNLDISNWGNSERRTFRRYEKELYDKNNSTE